jgi:ribosomal protein L17
MNPPHSPSGKPLGGKPLTRALLTALEESAPDADASNLRRIVDSLVSKAIAGDLAAIREIFDRLDGKAPTAAAGAGAEEPKQVEFSWKK